VFDAAGAVLWIATWAATGYVFCEQLKVVGDIVGRAGFRLFLTIVVSIAVWIAFKYFQRRRFVTKLNVERIPATELRRMPQDGEVPVIIDIRGGQALDDPIPGARRIPISEIGARHNEVPRDRDVILFCT
jgi:hypothetical protein